MDQLVTREGDLFQVSDDHGDFSAVAPVSGLYTRDTRFLSRFELLVNGERPRVLNATAASNVEQRVFAQVRRVQETFHELRIGVERRRLLYQGVMYERINFTNYERVDLDLRIEFLFDADFVDLFEVRGMNRTRRGEQQPTQVRTDSVVLGYRGLDGIVRHTLLLFVSTPTLVEAQRSLWDVSLPSRGSMAIGIAVAPGFDGEIPPITEFEQALAALATSYAQWHDTCMRITCDNELWSRVLKRSVLDLRVLLADVGDGQFPVAGIPWFAVPFGRDSLITAMQTLALTPDLARGTLRTLARLQGSVDDPRRQEQPGKILHELRQGEMANLDEVPFGRYYGSVDSTPLFLVLLGQYQDWTGDLELARELLPNIKAALRWLDLFGDGDGDGLLEFQAHGGGLSVQSWKDSFDSMSHRDGTPAASPVAVSEVQGYAYDARSRLAPILARLGETDLAQQVTDKAKESRASFVRAFWMGDRQYLAIAVDGAKQRVGTVASDAGHCLWSGILDAYHAAKVAGKLLAPDLFSGWGIRTLSDQEATYNPMSYHNGSVWPHDNALCVLGLKRYGFDQATTRVASALVEAAVHFPYFRLPELFCGYGRDVGPPVAYPVACSPQAWAAATPIALVHALLGLAPDAPNGILRLRPLLPDGVNQLSLRGLRVGAAVLDVEVSRSGVDAAVREGELQVVTEAVP